ncbi:hypothetical protein [Roseivirga sp.]|uniref:hypothetical protein n=1 Tax=Roseivirga sp. TaxID=1964215 RepID=UPI003B8DA1EB
MKGNKTDDLFRNGLGSHKITPPSAAWDKIESQLPKKSKKGIYFWMSVAASILIVLTSGWLLIGNNNANLSSGFEEKQASIKPAIVEEPSVDKKDDKQEEIQPAIEKATPARQLVTKSMSTDHKPQDNLPKDDNKVPVSTIKMTVSPSLQANSIDNIEKELTVPLLIDRIEFDLNTQQAFIANNTSITSLANDIEVNLNSYINSYEIMTMESASKRKRFSLLSGIVNVAKGVNNSKIAFSEIRKSKNDFFNNDLKYGTNAEESEDIDEDLNQQ